jgi:hypothetical protein
MIGRSKNDKAVSGRRPVGLRLQPGSRTSGPVRTGASALLLQIDVALD